MNGDLSEGSDIEDSGSRPNNGDSNPDSRGSFDCVKNNLSSLDDQLVNFDEQSTERQQLILKLRNIEEAINRKLKKDS